jgi:hypothetical protein
MDPSTTERSKAEIFPRGHAAADRLPWPVAVATIAGLAGSAWAIVWLVFLNVLT